MILLIHIDVYKRQVLARYVGWGGLSMAFDENNAAWAEEFKELNASLSPEEYRGEAGVQQMCIRDRFQIGWTPRAIQIMNGNESVLYVGTCTHLRG